MRFEKRKKKKDNYIDFGTHNCWLSNIKIINGKPVNLAKELTCQKKYDAARSSVYILNCYTYLRYKEVGFLIIYPQYYKELTVICQEKWFISTNHIVSLNL